MANWFKIYETDLDEKRLKYALSKLPEVGWVWIGILSECCKHRSDTLRWSEDEVDIFGFSDAMKVSIQKINHAIQLLCEINYIEQKDGKLRVIKWNEKQSEYNHRKQRGDYRRASETIGESPLEERRGEERKREESSALTETYFPEAETPSWKEFWGYCQTIGMHGEKYANDKFLAAEQENWKRQANWRAYAARVKGWWESDKRPMETIQASLTGEVGVKKPVKFLRHWDVENGPTKEQFTRKGVLDESSFEAHRTAWEEWVKTQPSGGGK